MIHPSTISQLYCRNCNRELEVHAERFEQHSFGMPPMPRADIEMECSFCQFRLYGREALHEIQPALLQIGAELPEDVVRVI